MDYFTADLHFGHGNIIKHTKRPFDGVGAMDEALLRNLNEAVGEDDRLFVLGDFMLGGGKEGGALRPKSYLDRIRCRHVILIRGNHDPEDTEGFEEVADYKELTVTIGGKQRLLVLSHYPMLEWNGFWQGAWHLYGHVHGRLGKKMPPRSLDVGVDNCGFVPLSYDDIQARISERTTGA